MDIRTYTPADHDAFCRLNRAWISEHWHLEPRDYEEMASFKDDVKGGFILVATDGPQVVGTLAMLPMDGREYDYELAKYTVSAHCRGTGIGRCLIAEALRRADSEGKGRIFIITNSLCLAAIHLYEAFGFYNIPGTSPQFDRGDYLMCRP